MKYLLTLVIFFTLLSATQGQDYYYQGGKVLPLRTNYYFDVTDNVSNTENGLVDNYDANQRQYLYADFEGFIFSDDHPLVQSNKDDFTQLSLYFNESTTDYLTILSQEMEDSDMSDQENWILVKDLGYLYKSASENTSPVFIYYGVRRKDYMTAAQQPAIDAAKRAGYEEIGVIGYILRSASQAINCKGSRTGAKLTLLENSQNQVTVLLDWDEGSTFHGMLEVNLGIENGRCTDCPRVGGIGNPRPNGSQKTYTIAKDNPGQDVVIRWGSITKNFCGADQSIVVPPVN